ncbi:MAG: UTP--glucose-1-phosphate uridylyltransferase GalU [Ruminobacter sp.]|uniref:UTP--glucose-1-phosphate uridylyltransferase n=1 Tax=Ruminobacter amylophilus TaxID=867 RepID=A0A662ZIT8_9GAMM|nr:MULTISPECIES: UTP--glucose-1-phosphate uridylyltransferase GalU [Ruminobacter]MBQ3775669.1 UTP--glucose-1-phosphate uridylyltransferase GalU [Ruminobacter sp.]SFP38560.1 UTP--glucose-1-phosphate uridylyltransferase [Ruminobacter amylophilus]
MKITKAVIPVAGLGTRMLPATKAIPKEMLPIVDKPLIQYVVNEAVAAGIKDIILVTHSSKNAIENHFDRSFELEATLEKRVKRQLLDEIQSICPHDVTIMHVRQGIAKGLGHAISCAKSLVNGEPFAVILPDDLIDEYSSDYSKDNLKKMISRYEETGKSQIMVEQVPMEDTSSYGVIDVPEEFKNRVIEPETDITIKGFSEKPKVEEAPSNLAIVGRYVLSPAIWDLLDETPIGAGDEIQLTDALRLLLRQEEIEAFVLKGRRLDCGSKFGYVKAFIEYALRHPKLQEEVRHYLLDEVYPKLN